MLAFLSDHNLWIAAISVWVLMYWMARVAVAIGEDLGRIEQKLIEIQEQRNAET